MNNVEYPCIKCGKKYYLNNYFNIGANRSLKLVECPFCHKKNYVIANTEFSINKEKINQSKKVNVWPFLFVLYTYSLIYI